MATNINYKLISEEINQILSGLYGLYISDGRPTKKGGLRFLDVKSNKTFGFEKTRETVDTETPALFATSLLVIILTIFYNKISIKSHKRLHKIILTFSKT